MLIAKKIAKKRLVAYIVIMAVMLAGMIFFVYKNYSLTFGKFRLTSGQPRPDNLEKPSLFGDNQAGEEKGAGEVNKASLDIGILNNPKFKSLKDNSIDQSVNPAP